MPEPANKEAVKCQRALLRGGAGFLKAKLKALDRCTNGILDCVQTKPGDERCVSKALFKCSGKLSSLGLAEERFSKSAAKKCNALTVQDLTSDTGLGFDRIGGECLDEFGLDVDDTGSLYQCVLRTFGRVGERLFAFQQARVRELLEFAVVRPLPLCNLPRRAAQCCLPGSEEAESCFPGEGAPQCALASPDQAKAVVKCAAAIAKGGTTFVAAVLASGERCVKAMLACEQTVAPAKQSNCREKARNACGTGFARLPAQRAKLDTTVAKSCGGVDESLLLGPNGLALGALVGPCDESPTSLASFKECLRRQHECEACRVLQGGVPGIDELLAMSAVAVPDGFCLDSPSTARLCPVPIPMPTETPGMVPFAFRSGARVAGETKFLRDIVSNTTGPGTRVLPGGFRPSKGNKGGNIKGIKATVPRFIPRSRLQEITVNYEVPDEVPGGVGPRLLMVARNGDGEAFDLFEIALAPSGADKLFVEFDKDFGECVRLEFATAQGGEDGDVSDYVPIEQVPETAPSSTPAPATTATSIVSPTPMMTATPAVTVPPTVTITGPTSTPSPTLTAATTGAPTPTVTFTASAASSTPTASPTPLPGQVLCNEGSVPEPIVFPYGFDSSGCGIGVPADIDTFRFTGAVGETIRIVLTGFTDQFDPRLEIRDPDGVTLIDVACDGNNNGCSVSADDIQTPPRSLPTLTKSGTYIVIVSDSGSNETGGYQLHIERFSPPDPTPLAMDSGLTGNVGSGVDIDVYAFVGTAGDDIRVVLTGTTDQFDPRLEIRDPDGVTLVNVACDGNSNGCSVSADSLQLAPRLLPVLAKNGQYLVIASDSGSNEGGNYSMHVERFRPSDAPVLALNSNQSDTITPHADIDSFAFDGEVGDNVRVVLTGTSDQYDPRLEVRDPNGVRIGDGACDGNSNGCTVNIDLALNTSGRYVINASDSGSNETGNYNISVQCLFGPCASP